VKSTLFIGAAFVGATALIGCTSEKKCDPTVPNTICTIAGSSLNEAYTGDGGQATDAELYITMDSTIAPNGDVWFIDFNNYVVRQIDDQGIITTVIGNSLLGDSPASEGLTQIPALQAANNHTTELAFGPDGNLYLSAWHESRVKKVDMSSMMMELYAGTGSRTFYTGDGGPAADAKVDLPSGISFDATGNMALMDQGNQVIRQIDTSTGNISTIAGQCIIEVEDCATFAPTACPNSDKQVCLDPGNATEVLATECMNSCSPGYVDGPAASARFNLPYGQAADPSGRLAYDHTGALIMTDTGNNALRKLDTNGMVSTIAGGSCTSAGCAPGYSGDGGPATQAMINHPEDLAIGPDNSIYFADTYNSCIRKIDPAGNISTVAGQCSTDPSAAGFAGDGGPPLAAKLNRPYGIDLEGSKLYISDSYNNRLRVVNLPN